MVPARAQILPLTGLRFFLALWVVIYHQPLIRGYKWLARFPAPLPVMARSGELAVGFFFVLSGFVLAYNYPLDEPWPRGRLTSYWIARFARIYPLHWLGLLLLISVSAFNPLVFALNWTLLQGWLPETVMSMNYPAWSLSAEVLFYACFPLLGAALWKLSRLSSLIRTVVLFWMAACIFPSLEHFTAITTLPPNQVFWWSFVAYHPLVHVPQFGVGIVVARIYHLLVSRNSRLIGRGYWLYVPGLVLELIGMVLFLKLESAYLNNGLLLPFHVLFVLGLALGGGPIPWILSVRPVVYMGKASYSLYILHFPVSVLVDKFAREYVRVRFSGPAAFGGYLMLLICLSAIVFPWIEEPANRFSKKVLKSWLDGARKGDLENPTVQRASAGLR